MTALIRVRDLTVTARATGATLVDGVSFDVEPGETVGIVGESGSGKSLTLRAILGMPPAGVAVAGGKGGAAPVTFDGGAGDADGTGDAPQARAPRMAMIFQDPVASLDPLCGVVRQVAEVIRYRQGASRRESRARAADLLVSLGLPESLRGRDRYPDQLSGGQCQRVGLAMALAVRPDILLCDEPTTALDVTVQRRILDLLADRRDRLGLTMLFVTHNLGVAAHLCSRLIVMEHGHIVETGPTARVVGDPHHPYTRRLIDAIAHIPEATR
ncbi:ABC transporter ATP-binding protein [Bifidobacterium platyrrhinorum]|uniref:ATP-binding cassette domain-containing protein n=1 Tax=Bifidobacterium platyrrhinorum TaxID=2661628 RepID=A0A6L9SVE3_9BIFI|nr:ABC transporter ATP-binding protein [Bifidobacterium platyrrhinorum]NEG55121.1 ATP-binding cassette domain-containing protein [Bifidobacterium platyrrhinorum]